MATNHGGYDAGPQLPNYMKKQMKQAIAAAAPARASSSRAPASRADAKKTVKRAPAASSRRVAASSAQRGTAQTAAAKAAKPKAAAKTTPARPAAKAKANRTAAAAKARTAQTAKKRRRSSGALKALAAIAGVALVVLLGVLIAGRGEGASADLSNFFSGKKAFKEGVKLIGVDVSGLTAQEATGLVKNAAEKKLKTVAITVRAGEREITLDANALGMGYSIEQALKDGLEYGRNDAVTEITGPGAGEYDAAYTWSREAIEIALANMSASIDTPAAEPFAEPIKDWASEARFNYVEGVPGQALNIAKTADNIEYALRKLAFQSDVEAVTNAVLPQKTLEEVRGATQLIASFATKFSVDRSDEIRVNRKFNIEKAADIINGMTVQPGEEWSFNTVVGPRTYDLGWKGANGISGGKEYTVQAGGGICQVSTTLYNALLCANLEIVYRQAHTIPSDYAAYGFDATVDTGRIDFIWKNNTGHPLYIFARVLKTEGSSSRHTMNVYVYGEPLPDGVVYKPRSELISTAPRTDVEYTQDAGIPTGYQKQTNIRRDAYVAEAYLDKFVNGKLESSVLLYTDKYDGNPARIAVGTGPALAPGQLPDPLWDVYGTPPKSPGA